MLFARRREAEAPVACVERMHLIGVGPPLRGLVRIVSTHIDLDDTLMVTGECGNFNQSLSYVVDGPEDPVLFSLPGPARQRGPAGIAESLV